MSPVLPLALALSTGLAALAWPGSSPLPATQGELARVRSAQLPREYSSGSAAVGDLDGDGEDDLVVSAVERGGARARALFLFPTGSAGELGAGRRLELALDVTAWALGDVHPDPGLELVLFTARGAFVARPDAPEDQRFALLAGADFLWQLPDGEPAFLWDRGLADLDGDGRVDLLLPEPGGYAVAFGRERPEQADAQQDDGGTPGFAAPVRVRIPFDATPVGTYVASSGGRAGWRGQRSERELGLSHSVSSGVDDDFQLPSLLLTVSESVPAPQVIDWDGDRDLDLLAQTRTGLHVFPQERGRSFGQRTSYPLPVEADRDRRLDASYSSHAVDLDGDARADCVIFAGDSQKSEVRTQTLVFVQGAGRGDAAQTPEAPLFGPRGRPQDLLVFAGFVVRPDFVDVDGDGLLDLAISGVRPDLIDQLRSISSESIEADLFVYRGRGSGFSRQPDLAFTLAVPIEQFEPTARFIGDVTGDRISELLLRDDPERLRLLMVRAGRGQGQLGVIEKPLWELKLNGEARVRTQPVAGRKLPDVLVIERSQVQHVRFR